MANKYLGSTIDIHGGGLDLIFPHHENEIAQSESYNGCTFAHYWVHNGLIMVDGKKMSKSLGNFVPVKEILKDYHSDIIRFAVLSYGYNSAVDFSDALLSNASKRVYYYYKTLSAVHFLTKKNGCSNLHYKLPSFVSNMLQDFQNNMNNNFNTTKVIASFSCTFSFINDLIGNKSVDEKEKTFILNSFLSKFKTISEVFKIFNENPTNFIEDFKLRFIKKNRISLNFIMDNIEKRKEAKKKKDYVFADDIRKILIGKGINIQDFADGETFWDIIIC